MLIFLQKWINPTWNTILKIMFISTTLALISLQHWNCALKHGFIFSKAIVVRNMISFVFENHVIKHNFVLYFENHVMIVANISTGSLSGNVNVSIFVIITIITFIIILITSIIIIIVRVIYLLLLSCIIYYLLLRFSLLLLLL